jgi:hypothetical protein
MRDSMLTSRRDFLKAAGGLAGSVAVGAISQAGMSQTASARHCITIFLVGGPSQIETFDPKPGAPSSVRGPFGVTQTPVPGVYLSETLPQMARIADRLAIIRTMHHDAAPIHETGLRLVQSGRLGSHDLEPPHLASVLSFLRGTTADSAFAIIPHRIVDTGVSYGHGQSASYLGDRHAPWDWAALQNEPRWRSALQVNQEPRYIQERYGQHLLGRSCCAARRLIEHGMQFVTVNMFSTVFDQVTWDCHADGGSLASSLHDYRTTLCPMLDQAFSALIRDLEERGLLEDTLVMVLGEFGRTPRMNPRGGRDHWPGCWSIVLAGGGISGGQVVGRSDAWAAEPADRPVTPAELAATVFTLHGYSPSQPIPGPNGQLIPLADADPIWELVS